MKGAWTCATTLAAITPFEYSLMSPYHSFSGLQVLNVSSHGSSTRRRRIAVVSVARSDYGIYRPLLRAITGDPSLELQLIVGASHLTDRFGDTLAEIEADQFAIAARVECTSTSDTAADIAQCMARATSGFAAAYDSLAPDLLVALGDRYEMHAAVVAAVPFLLPVAHIAGGAITQGAIDDGLRHSISKLSHLHFPETADQADCLRRLGEEDSRIHVAGSLSIDNVRTVKTMNRGELERRIGLSITNTPLLLASYHPVTRDYKNTESQLNELIAALAETECAILFTYPNADSGSRLIIERIEAFAQLRPGRVAVVPNLGTEAYFGAMTAAAAMIGNSFERHHRSRELRATGHQHWPTAGGTLRPAQCHPLRTCSRRNQARSVTGPAREVPLVADRNGQSLWRRPRQHANIGRTQNRSPR